MQHPFRHAQRLGLDLDRHIVLDAGAGTGKTTVMAERYVQHLLTAAQRATLLTPAGTRPNRPGAGASLAAPRDRLTPEAWPGLLPTEVVAITFTRKAAAALRSRIKRRITASAARPSRATMRALSTCDGAAEQRAWWTSSRPCSTTPR